MKRKIRKICFLIMSLVICTSCIIPYCSMPVKAETKDDEASEAEETVTLRVCNWEEYIDLGDWDEEELIELENGVQIIGENSMIEDFEAWYYETYGIRVNVEYSCFGTNEDLYNMLNLGDVYDLVCPSEYLIMKLMAEEKLVPYSEEFFDETNENNYYIKGVSPFIRERFENNEINGETWDRYAAGYMWGVTGIVYNPEEMSREEASTWSVLNNKKFNRRVTIKDNVRDSYFAAIGIIKSKLLCDEEFVNSEDYSRLLAEEMNDVSPETIAEVEDILQDMQDNVYSFETDSGKADMVSGKVVANYQWSGDAVYTMEQAEEDGYMLEFAVPEESTNLYFDGWIMLKSGIGTDKAKQHAAESFVNYLSRPDNAIRNMYYIGYTSVIAGEPDDDTIFEYINWNYAAEEDEEAEAYYLGYFFSGDKEDEKYIINVPKSQLGRQLYAQYPTEDVINRSAIMEYFDDEASKAINQMWINVRCYNIQDVPRKVWVFCTIIIAGVVLLITARLVYKRSYKKYI